MAGIRSHLTILMLAILMLAIPVVGAGEARAQPAETLRDLHGALRTCARSHAPRPDWAGYELTVRFSIRRDGHLIGQPRITYSSPPPDHDGRDAFAADSLNAVMKCFPVDITPGLGGAVAGRIITIRMGGGRARVRMPLNRI